MAIALSLATCVSTLLGGLFALHLSDRLHLILGFSAGALIGVAFFDLIPEALNLATAAGQEAVTATIAAGFVCYMLLDRTVAPHGDKGARTENLWRRGVLGASSLAAHSFLDGLAIGLAFRVSTAVGAIVAAAVLAHDYVQPFIRYEVHDVVTLSPTRCPCGSVLPFISSIEGRTKDKLWIKTQEGYRDLPYYLFLAALHNELDMAEHQVVQKGVNSYTLRALPLPGRSLSPDRLRQLVFQSVSSEGLEKHVHLDVEIVNAIERGPSGKAIRVKNEFGPPPETPIAKSA